MTKYKTTRKLESFDPKLVELVLQAALRDIRVPCKDVSQLHSLKMRCYQIRRLLAATDHPNKELILRTAFRAEGDTNTLVCGIADKDVHDVVSAALESVGVTPGSSEPNLEHLAEDPYKL